MQFSSLPCCSDIPNTLLTASLFHTFLHLTSTLLCTTLAALTLITSYLFQIKKAQLLSVAFLDVNQFLLLFLLGFLHLDALRLLCLFLPFLPSTGPFSGVSIFHRCSSDYLFSSLSVTFLILLVLYLLIRAFEF